LGIITEQEIIERIGHSIKQIRLQHNLSQKKLSEDVGLSVSTISLIEQGEINNRRQPHQNTDKAQQN